MIKGYKMNGKSLIKVTKEAVKKVDMVINGVHCATRNNLSDAGQAGIKKKTSHKISKDIAYVGKGVILRVKKGQYGLYIKGEVFNTIIGNSPFTRGLTKANGDLNKIGSPTLAIKHWDKDEKQLVFDYNVVCNDRDSNESGIRFIETNAVCTMDFSLLESGLRHYCDNNEELIAQEKQKLIDQIFTLGLDIREDGTVHCCHNPKGTLYNIISWSPSNERNESATFTCLPTSEAFKIINEISGGALESALQRERTIGELIKFSKRIGILSAPSVETIKFGNENFGCIIYTKETKGPEDYDAENKKKLKDAGITIDRNTFDGAVVYSARFIQAMLAILGIKVSLGQANLLALQTRASMLLTKVFGEGKSDMNIKFRKDVYLSSVPKDRILKVAAGEDVSHLDKSKYDLIIVGNENNIGMILDANGSKALKDISLQDIANGNFVNYILDMAKYSDTNTSGQLLQKFIAADKEGTMKAMFTLISDQLGNRLNEYLYGDIDAKTCSLGNYILRHVEKGAENSEALKSVIENELTQLESQFKNYKVKLDAIFLRALFDDSYFITKGKINGVLGVSKYTGKLEAYSYDVELRFKDQIDAIYADDSITDKEKALDELLTGVVIKYPSPSADENVCMTFKTARQLIERIAYMNMLTVQQREVLIDDFVNTSYGVIKMAPNNTIKHRLAGMDTDYDGVAVIFERALVEIILKDSEEKGHDGLTVIKSV